MRKVFYLAIILACSINLVGQVGAPGFSAEWHRGGNFFGGGGAGNNIFGTNWNSSIYHYTDGNFRMILNNTQNFNAAYIGPYLGNIAPYYLFKWQTLA